MADHKFHGKVQIQPGTASNHAVTKNQLDTAAANASDLSNATGSIDTSFISDFGTEVDTRIQDVVGAAPGALDTLEELATALGDDPNFAATVTDELGDLDSRVVALEANTGTGGYKGTVGDSTVSSFVVTHGLGSSDVVVTIIELSNGQTVYPVVTRTDNNSVTVDFGSFVPTNDSHRVLVQPV